MKNKKAKALIATALATTMIAGIITPHLAQSQYADVESYYIFGTKYYDEFYEDLNFSVEYYAPGNEEFYAALRAADYYRIAWEADTALRRDPEGDNPHFAQNAWLDWQAQGDGTFSLEMRLALREAVEDFKLDKEFIPFDYDFWLDTTKVEGSTGVVTGNSGGNTYKIADALRFKRAWLLSRGVDVEPPTPLNPVVKDDGTSAYYDEITDSYFDTRFPSKEEYNDRYAEWKAECDAQKTAENAAGNEPVTDGNSNTGSSDSPDNSAIGTPVSGESTADQLPLGTGNTEPTTITESAFADVPLDSWYGEAVNKMVESGLIKGKDDGLFHPDDVMTVGEWCMLLYRLTYSDPNETWTRYVSSSVELTHWSAMAINRCRGHDYTRMSPCYTSNGIQDVLSIPDGLPGEITPVQRGEAVNAIIEILKDANMFNSGSCSSDFGWTDIPDASEILAGVVPSSCYLGEPNYWKTHYWNADNILVAYQLHITTGVDAAGTFNPAGLLTRAQACKLLYDAGLDHRLNLFSEASSGHLVSSN